MLALLSTLPTLVLHPAVTTRTCRDTKLQVIGQWSDPCWNWGSANGEAHNEAMRLRASLSTPEKRERFLTDVGMLDEEDWEDSKVVLALACQRASKLCYAKDYPNLDKEAQLAWRALMNHSILSPGGATSDSSGLKTTPVTTQANSKRPFTLRKTAWVT